MTGNRPEESFVSYYIIIIYCYSNILFCLSYQLSIILILFITIVSGSISQSPSFTPTLLSRNHLNIFKGLAKY